MSSVHEVNINLIYPMVEAKAPNELEAVMEDQKFQHPIVLYRTTKYEWEQDKLKRYPQLLDPPDTGGSILQIRCGHNRVALYKKWGINTISAVVYDNLIDATAACKVQQKWHKQRYGSLD